MAVAEPYSDPTISPPPSLIQRAIGGSTAGLGMASLAASLKEPAQRAVERVRANPRPYVIGALAVAVAAVGVALLSNRHVRRAGIDTAKKITNRRGH